jgi:hypothetical protein
VRHEQFDVFYYRRATALAELTGAEVNSEPPIAASAVVGKIKPQFMSDAGYKHGGGILVNYNK